MVSAEFGWAAFMRVRAESLRLGVRSVSVGCVALELPHDSSKLVGPEPLRELHPWSTSATCRGVPADGRVRRPRFAYKLFPHLLTSNRSRDLVGDVALQRPQKTIAAVIQNSQLILLRSTTRLARSTEGCRRT